MTDYDTPETPPFRLPPMFDVPAGPPARRGLDDAQEVRTWALDAAVQAGSFDIIEGIVTNRDVIAATLQRAEAFERYITTGQTMPDAEIVEDDEPDPENEDATLQAVLDVLDEVEKEVEEKAATLGVTRPGYRHAAAETLQVIRLKLDGGPVPVERRPPVDIFAVLDQVETEAGDAIEVGDYTENERKFARDQVATTIDSIRQELRIKNGDL